MTTSKKKGSFFRLSEDASMILAAWAEVVRMPPKQSNQTAVLEKIIINSYEQLDKKTKKRIDEQIAHWKKNV